MDLTSPRRVTVLTMLSAALVLGTLSTSVVSASAAPHPVGADGTVTDGTVTETTSGRPPHGIWIADVTAVTDQASAYLASRLPDPSIKPAIVLDIDNSALETAYGGPFPPATKPVLTLAKQAHDAGAAVIFVTARPEFLSWLTELNLAVAGYPNDGMYMRQLLDFSGAQDLKTGARTLIEQDGYTIVANIGNNDTDLAGGHAERSFKLPDYDGQLN